MIFSFFCMLHVLTHEVSVSSLCTGTSMNLSSSVNTFLNDLASAAVLQADTSTRAVMRVAGVAVSNIGDGLRLGGGQTVALREERRPLYASGS